MKLVLPAWSDPKQIPFSIAQAVESNCQDSDHRGVAESAHEMVGQTSRMLGQLIESLHARGTITDMQVLDLLGHRYEKDERK